MLQRTQIISDVCFITDHVAYASSNNTKIVGIEAELFSFLLLPAVDTSHVYVRTWALGCFHSLITNLSEGADRVGGQLRGDQECPFSGVIKSGRVWRKVSESDARSVHYFDRHPVIGLGDFPSLFLLSNIFFSSHNSRKGGRAEVRGRSGRGIVPPTLRASLSGTFLQTLPDLVTPLKGQSLSLRSCPPTRSAPSKRLGY